MDKEMNPVIYAIQENNRKENGKPQKRKGSKSSGNDRLVEFILLSVSSIFISFVPICLIALLKPIGDNYLVLVFGNPDVLFTITTLLISVICELFFMRKQNDSITGYLLPFLFIFVIWSMGAYAFLNTSQSGTYAYEYRVHIITITLIVSFISSCVIVFLANRNN